MFTIDSSLASHVQAPPLNRLLLLVQQVHQNCCMPLREHTQECDRAEATESLLKLGVWFF